MITAYGTQSVSESTVERWLAKFSLSLTLVDLGVDKNIAADPVAKPGLHPQDHRSF